MSDKCSISLKFVFLVVIEFSSFFITFREFHQRRFIDSKLFQKCIKLICLITEMCSYTTTLNSNAGTIYSPNYPKNYGNNIARCWRFNSLSSNYKIRFTMNSLNLERCPECNCDSIEIFDGSSQSSRSLGKYCSGNIDLTSSSSYMFVKFTSDSSGFGEKFSASYLRVAKSKKILSGNY